MSLSCESHGLLANRTGYPTRSKDLDVRIAMAELVGVWKLVALRNGDAVVGTSQTHLVAHPDGVMWQPDSQGIVYDDEVAIEMSWALVGDELKIHRRWVQPDGSLQRESHQVMHVRRLTTDQLELEDEDEEEVATYRRETDPAAIAAHAAAPRRAPRKVRLHATLGRLAWDANLSWWCGRASFLGHGVFRFFLELDEDAGAEKFDSASDRIETLLSRLDQWKEFAADGLLEIHNDAWRNEGEPEADRRTFCASLTVAELALDRAGSGTLYLDAGDLFWGHGIELRFDADLRPSDEPGLVG